MPPAGIDRKCGCSHDDAEAHRHTPADPAAPDHHDVTTTKNLAGLRAKIREYDAITAPDPHSNVKDHEAYWDARQERSEDALAAYRSLHLTTLRPLRLKLQHQRDDDHTEAVLTDLDGLLSVLRDIEQASERHT